MPKRQCTWKGQLLLARTPNRWAFHCHCRLNISTPRTFAQHPSSQFENISSPAWSLHYGSCHGYKVLCKMLTGAESELGKAHDDDLRLACICIACVPVESSCWTEGLKWPIDLAWKHLRCCPDAVCQRCGQHRDVEGETKSIQMISCYTNSKMTAVFPPKWPK